MYSGYNLSKIGGCPAPTSWARGHYFCCHDLSILFPSWLFASSSCTSDVSEHLIACCMCYMHCKQRTRTAAGVISRPMHAASAEKYATNMRQTNSLVCKSRGDEQNLYRKAKSVAEKSIALTGMGQGGRKMRKVQHSQRAHT